MARVLTFGELMLRLSPPGYERILQSPRFEASFGGGEANVAVSLVKLGVSCAFATRLPENALGDAAMGELARQGVDTSWIIRGGERMGIYYCERGAAQRASKVIYDRKHSGIAEAKPGDFDWGAALTGCEWFHFTGITPALSDGDAALCLEAIKAARAKKLRVSCDLNYRKNLWSGEKAASVMRGLMPYVDVLLANEEDSEKVFGIKAEGSDVAAGEISREGYGKLARRLTEEFGFKAVAITLRKSRSASDNGWSGMLYEDGQAHFSREYEIHIVDRVGGGDSFAAGLIAAKLGGKDAAGAVEFAAAASALKHSIEGDFNLATLKEVEALAAGDGSGRVSR
jgi:2-dehydro-3-deoxygluconokinase